VTDDYINPAYEWPDLRELEAVADAGGVPLRERLPTYARYLPDDIRPAGVDPARDPPGHENWVPSTVRERIDADDVHGRRLRAVARGDGPLAVRSD
jgi:FO synthase subunit 1